MEIEHIGAFRHLIQNELEAFLQETNHFGGLIRTMTDKVKRGFDLQLEFIKDGVCREKPNHEELQPLIKPLSDLFDEIQDFRNSNRHEEEYFNHLSTISESILALSWIARPAPANFVKDMMDAGQYFGNRVLSANRSMKHHCLWIMKWGKVLSALEKYVRDYHVAGFDWGAAIRAGMAVPRQGAAPGGSPPSASGAAIPPPPPPPARSAGDWHEADRSALFSEINRQGQKITQILRPVTYDVDTHLRGAHATTSRAQPAPPPVQHTPKLQLEGRKWRVEYQKENYALVVESTDMSESLAMYKCEQVGLEIRNKMNGISIDTTKKSTIALNDVISSVELIRCSDVKIQCNGKVPLISVDKCESVQIFLTSSSIGVELISSNSTALNICVLEEDGTYVELPVPEQIRTVILNGKLHSTALEKN